MRHHHIHTIRIIEGATKTNKLPALRPSKEKTERKHIGESTSEKKVRAMSTSRLIRPGVFARRVNEMEAVRPDASSARSHRVSVLSSRLEEALVYIIHADGYDSLILLVVRNASSTLSLRHHYF